MVTAPSSPATTAPSASNSSSSPDSTLRAMAMILSPSSGRLNVTPWVLRPVTLTSSTQLRTWVTSTGGAHHIIDPRSGRTAVPTWAHVTCVAVTALEANTASTAAIVLGEDAVAWLSSHGVAARLERPDGSVVCTAGWPEPASSEEVS